MDTDEFVDYYSLHRAPEFREISAEDIKHWVNLNVLHAPPYYRGATDTGIVRGILQVESESGRHRVTSERISPREEYPQYESRSRKEKRLKRQESKGWKER